MPNLCNVTGFLRDLEGNLLPNTQLRLQRIGVKGQDGVTVLPYDFEVVSDGVGFMDFHAFPGNYSGHVIASGRNEVFGVSIPVEDEIDFSLTIDSEVQITSISVSDAQAAAVSAAASEGSATASELSASASAESASAASASAESAAASEASALQVSSGKELEDVLALDDPLVVLATGQSNMLGGSTPSGAARVIRNPNVYVWSQPTLSWLVTAPGMPDWPFLSVGNNLAYVYCDARQRARGGVVMLFMHAVGGQPIAEWLPNGGGNAGATGALWAALNSRWTSARSATIPNRTDSATLNSLGITAAHEMIFHQGKSDDDASGTTGPQWRSRLGLFIANSRDPASQGLSSDPLILLKAPVLIGEVFEGGAGNRNDDMAIFASSEPLVDVVSSNGLTASDGIHFDATSLVTLGRRYADRIGILPKLVKPTLRGNGVSIDAGITQTITIGGTMRDDSYVPAVAIIAHGSSSPYLPTLSNRTTTTFDLTNTGSSNMVVSWSISDDQEL